MPSHNERMQAITDAIAAINNPNAPANPLQAPLIEALQAIYDELDAIRAVFVNIPAPAHIKRLD